MRRILFIVFTAFILFNCGDHRQAAAEELKKAENFTLNDLDGKAHSLEQYRDAKAIVLIWVSTQCPVSNDYNTRMAALYEQYKDKGIVFLGINSNKAESIEEIKTHADENNLRFTILKDPGNVIADKFSASFTPEVYVLNGALELLYHGRIDDSRRESGITKRDLSAALDEILDGKKVSVAKTKAFGCTIKRVN
jgi:peroxiredoxin